MGRDGVTGRVDHLIESASLTSCQVHASRGRLAPASPHLLSEVAIIGWLARRTLRDGRNPCPRAWNPFPRVAEPADGTPCPMITAGARRVR
ncbi:hypothetical protein DN051_09740 [Streptomyces cadmiisoli]|uniref:Uncharacterized protein n=1 Tax=Streptomyces cadmiisoli TaxID=2184053 RepID=A0A2Z4IWA5_9ACTN|nr:hypothetical protein DN051_09740 [Streptomyces cadmiisoli]